MHSHLKTQYSWNKFKSVVKSRAVSINAGPSNSHLDLERYGLRQQNLEKIGTVHISQLRLLRNSHPHRKKYTKTATFSGPAGPQRFQIMYLWCFLLFVLTLLIPDVINLHDPHVQNEQIIHPCSSNIYCHGRLLHTIQMAKIYPDSKEFVDKKMKAPPIVTLANFDKFMEEHDDHPNRSEVIRFVNENFEHNHTEFEKWYPKDWTEKPKFIYNIKDENLRRWGESLNRIWKDLGRQIKREIEKEKDFYSIIWVEHPVIVPGGRFREFYYWDSYWIIQGLLLSEMYSTSKGMLKNFIDIVNRYGHIPNGGRIYYLERSQPPLLTPMVKLYVDATKEIEFIAENINSLDNEFSYWMTNHTKAIEFEGKNYTLAVYGDRSRGPRPESYSEDIETAEIFAEDEKKEALYSELKAAAESGWDFSSRWFICNATNKGNLTNTKTRSIVPVDLNAIIYWNAVLLKEFHEILGNIEKAQYYNNVAQNWLEAVTAVLWHEEVGAWLDYDLHNSIKRDYFYPTNIAPLWTGCYRQEDKDKTVRLVLKYLQNKKLFSFLGGIPTTLEHTGEQWDYPNAWPPLQHMMIVGLNNTGNAAAKKLALEVATTWVKTNYKAFNKTNSMFEKYDATVLGGHGSGGEYDIQEGFGWTNGIIIYLLDTYGGAIQLHDEEELLEEEEEEFAHQIHELQISVAAPNTLVQVTTGIVGLIVSLAVGYIGVSIYKRRAGSQAIKKKKERPSRSQYTELRNMPRQARTVR